MIKYFKERKNKMWKLWPKAWLWAEVFKQICRLQSWFCPLY